jgi:hypothetical protein
MLRASSAVVSALALVLVFGCSESSDPAPPGPGTGGGDTTPQMALLTDNATGLPLADVGIAWDLKDGTRVEQWSDADGLAPIEVDLEQVVTAIAHKPGYSFQGSTGAFMRFAVDAFEAAGEPFGVGLSPLVDTPPAVTLSGQAMGMQDDGNWLNVNATAANSTLYQQEGNPNFGHIWRVDVPPAVPFTLTAFEFSWGGTTVSARGVARTFHSWDFSQSDGVTADTAMDMSMGAMATPQQVSGSFAMPAHNALATLSKPLLRVRGGEGDHGYLGATSMIDVSPDNATINYDAVWIEPPGVPLTTVYRLTNESPPLNHEMTELRIDGVPASGSQDLQFLIPPTIASARIQHPLHAAVRWRLPDGQTHTRTAVGYSGGPGFGSGAMLLMGDETEVALPALPSTSDEGEIFGEGITIAVTIQRCAETPGDCQASARGTPALAIP